MKLGPAVLAASLLGFGLASATRSRPGTGVDCREAETTCRATSGSDTSTQRGEPPRDNSVIEQNHAPTFYSDILPILQQHCQSCHRPGEIGPMPLVTFEQTKPFAAQIARRVAARVMPPWFADPTVGHFSNDPSLTDAEIRSITAWAAAGSPPGSPTVAPPPLPWTLGWNIPTPNRVIRMSQPVDIPSDGDIAYTFEIVPTGFTRDTWVRMSEIVPSDRAHVHHAVVYIRPPDSRWLRSAPVGVPFTEWTLNDVQAQRDTRETQSDMLLVYAPGSSPDRWPENMAKMIPAGSDLVFQMHYTTNGHAGRDRTQIGLVFASAPPQERVLTLQLTNRNFVIPPGVSNYRVEVHGTLPQAATLLSFFPHMHLRGKKFEYNLVTPDGSPLGHIETLLRVNYDFYWQLSYRLAQPRPLPVGAELQAVAWFDNSAANKHNPDPTVAVHWGDQTYDEMMVGFFDVAVPAIVDKQRFFLRQ